MSSYISSPAIINSVFVTIPVPRKAAVHRHSKIDGRGRTVRIPAHNAPRVMLQPTAMMVDGTSVNARPVITVHSPSVWGDIFATSCLDDEVQQKYSKEIDNLKKEARSMLMAPISTKLMILIDKLERLGLAYHFEKEIEEKIKQIYDHAEEEKENDYDLFTTALRFRLLRKHQYHASSHVFAKFVDNDNKLNEKLISSDIEGLLSLYEAAHFRIHNENVLEEAAAFTTDHLSHMLLQLESPLREKVQHALTYPLHRSITIITLRSYIDIYEDDDSRDDLLLKLAKLNFNYMQNVFRNELFEITTWWNEFNRKSKVPYIRDRLVESYMWTLSFHYEPHHSLVRTVMTKFLLLVTDFDDTYDSYATLEEMDLFTRALERWNIDEIDRLPDNLKRVYKIIMSFSEEFECEAKKHGKSYVVPYFIAEIKRLGWGYGQEQKWIMLKQMPSFEEYLIHSRITSLVCLSFLALTGLTKSGTKENLDWVLNGEILNAASDIVRLRDDLATHRRERRDGTAVSPMDHYMKEKGASMQEIECEFKALIEERWKDLNAEWMTCSSMVPKEMVMPVVELIRMCEIVYMNGIDGVTDPEKHMAPLATALFLQELSTDFKRI